MCKVAKATITKATEQPMEESGGTRKCNHEVLAKINLIGDWIGFIFGVEEGFGHNRRCWSRWNKEMSASAPGAGRKLNAWDWAKRQSASTQV